ncbi:MAG: hypothetical protein IJG82_01425 [Atopobiaceae bacterium]|nr:hypothetical protein [Atopobiaceae bacterium]
MSITDELRKWARCHRGLYMVEDALLAIADRIDEEHADAVADALQLRGGEDRWVELPVDADGKLINLGDKVIEEGCGGVASTVMSLVLRPDGWMVNMSLMLPDDLHHVQPDSWESIIRDAFEFGAENAYDTANRTSAYDCEFESLVERCEKFAAKEDAR